MKTIKPIYYTHGDTDLCAKFTRNAWGSWVTYLYVKKRLFWVSWWHRVHEEHVNIHHLEDLPKFETAQAAHRQGAEKAFKKYISWCD